MLSHEQAQELTRLIRRFQSVLDEIHAWPADDEEYRALLLELRELHRVLDEKLPRRRSRSRETASRSHGGTRDARARARRL